MVTWQTYAMISQNIESSSNVAMKSVGNKRKLRSKWSKQKTGRKSRNAQRRRDGVEASSVKLLFSRHYFLPPPLVTFLFFVGLQVVWFFPSIGRPLFQTYQNPLFSKLLISKNFSLLLFLQLICMKQFTPGNFQNLVVYFWTPHHNSLPFPSNHLNYNYPFCKTTIQAHHWNRQETKVKREMWRIRDLISHAPKGYQSF